MPYQRDEPNRMSAKDLREHQRLNFVSADHKGSKVESETRHHNLPCRVGPTEALSIWVRPYAIRLSEKSFLTREYS